MGSKSGNNHYIVILVGAEMKNVQKNYHDFDTIVVQQNDNAKHHGKDHKTLITRHHE